MFGNVALAGFTALITLAVVAVIVSQRAQTQAIITAIGGATAQSIGAAVSPVTGGSTAGG